MLKKLGRALLAGIAWATDTIRAPLAWITDRIFGRRGGGLPPLDDGSVDEPSSIVADEAERKIDLRERQNRNDVFETVRKFVRGTDAQRVSSDLRGVPAPVRLVLLTLSKAECAALSTSGDRAIARLAAGEHHGVHGVTEVSDKPRLKVVKPAEPEPDPEMWDAVAKLMRDGHTQPFQRPKSFRAQ